MTLDDEPSKLQPDVNNFKGDIKDSRRERGKRKRREKS